MRAWPLHVVFATLLVGSLAAKERAADQIGDYLDRETAVGRIARSNGLALREYGTVLGLPALTLEAPGCSRPVLVVLRLTFDEDAAFSSARERGDVLRYIYIDRSWEKP